ncbi:hypothetical protein KY366_02445, partial [Candidatus Woesearchaeota archaeon]|nr:hypothetical protein [Candidatus Woesearchaeota archaeon]
MKANILIFMLLLLILSISLSSAIKTITVNETDFVSLRPKARDEDGDRLFYSFTRPLDNEGNWQTGYGDAGSYSITVTVSDGELNTSTDVLLVVNKRNIGPAINSSSPEQEELEISEGDSISFSVKAYDLNKDSLAYAWQVDDKIISRKASYTYRAGYTDAGRHSIKVIVSDGEEKEEKGWDVWVNDVDRRSLLDSISDMTVNEGETVFLDLPDFERYDLKYKISGPIGRNNTWVTGYDDAGVYDITITITDQNLSFSKKIKATVIDMDRQPVFTPISSVWMSENKKVSIDLEAYDPDDDKIEFSAENLPDGASLEGSRFEWATGFETARKENVLDKALDKFHLLYKPFKITFIAKSKGLEA